MGWDKELTSTPLTRATTHFLLYGQVGIESSPRCSDTTDYQSY